jgi:transposase
MEAVKTNSRKVDFSGQNIYVGLDVHHKSWSVNIYSDEFELKSFSQEPDVERLCNHLQTQYKGANYLVGYESGFWGFWIQRAFKQRGFDCRVLHAADVPTNNKEHLRKTDKVDSRKIAKGLKNGDMNFIHVPDVELELDRQLVRTRLALTRDSTRCKNRIKALLKLHGIGIPDSYSASRWSGKLLKWLMDVDFGS